MLQPYILVFDLFTSSRNLQGKIRCYFGRVAAVLIPRTRYSKILNPTRVLFRIFVAEMGLMLGMEAKQKRKKIKRLFGTQPGCPKRPKLVRATPWADFVVIGDQVWSTMVAIFTCLALSWLSFLLDFQLSFFLDYWLSFFLDYQDCLSYLIINCLSFLITDHLSFLIIKKVPHMTWLSRKCHTSW